MAGVLRSPWTGWVVAAGLLLVLWGSRARQAPAGEADVAGGAGDACPPCGPATAAAADPPAGAIAGTGQLALLSTCRRRLQRCSAGAPDLDGKPARADHAQPTAPAAAPPAAAAEGGAGSGTGAAPPADGPRGERRRSGDADTPAGNRILTQLLDVPPEEARWLGEYVCAVRDLRRDALEQLEAAVDDPEAIGPAMDDAKQQREAVLDDLKTRLGEERYARLRSIGGLSLIGAKLDCDAER